MLLTQFKAHTSSAKVFRFRTPGSPISEYPQPSDPRSIQARICILALNICQLVGHFWWRVRRSLCLFETSGPFLPGTRRIAMKANPTIAFMIFVSVPKKRIPCFRTSPTNVTRPWTAKKMEFELTNSQTCNVAFKKVKLITRCRNLAKEQQ